MKTPRWVGLTAAWSRIVLGGRRVDCVAPVEQTVTTPDLKEPTGRHRIKLAVAAAVDETWRLSVAAVFAPAARIAQAQWFIPVQRARSTRAKASRALMPARTAPLPGLSAQKEAPPTETPAPMGATASILAQSWSARKGASARPGVTLRPFALWERTIQTRVRRASMRVSNAARERYASPQDVHKKPSALSDHGVLLGAVGLVRSQ